MTALRKMKSGKATRPLEVHSKIIIASDDTGIKVMVELCQRVLDGRGMPEEWRTKMGKNFFLKFYGLLFQNIPFTIKTPCVK